MPDTDQILLVIPTTFELAPLAVVLGARPAGGALVSACGCFVLFCPGLGGKNVRRKLPALLATRPFSLVLSAGCAGAVRRGLPAGAVLQPRLVRSADGASLPLAPLPPLPGCFPVDALVSVARPAGRLDKESLARRFPDAWAVDMESFWTVQAARAAGVPAAVLRVPVDRAGADVPDWNGSGFRHWCRLFLYKRRARRYCRRLGRLLRVNAARLRVSDGDGQGAQVRLDVADGELPEVEQGGGEHG